MKPLNGYFILKVPPEASLKEIKTAYLKLVTLYHPDKHRGNKLAEKKFQQINQAWEILKDPTKRRLLDERLKSLKQNTPQRSFSVLKEKPIDLALSLKITLEELCGGGEKTLSYLKPVAGKKIKSHLTFKIPQNFKQGSRLRFKGQGGAEGKASFGDLYVSLNLKPHKLFKPVKNSWDLLLNYPLPFTLAFTAQKLEIPSPFGFLTVDIKPPLKDKQLLKLKNQGLYKNSKNQRGDFFVQILIEYPLNPGFKPEFKKQESKIKKHFKGFVFSSKAELY